MCSTFKSIKLYQCLQYCLKHVSFLWKYVYIMYLLKVVLIPKETPHFVMNWYSFTLTRTYDSNWHIIITTAWTTEKTGSPRWMVWHCQLKQSTDTPWSRMSFAEQRISDMQSCFRTIDVSYVPQHCYSLSTEAGICWVALSDLLLWSR